MKKLFISIILMVFLAIPMAALASSDVTLEWDPNTEADLAGYKIYYGLSSGGPYDGTGVVNDSPIDVGNVTTYTVHGLPDGTIYFVATAYDLGDNESDYSNEVTATLDTEAPAPPKNLIIMLIQKIFAFLKSIFDGWFCGLKIVA